MNRTTPPLQAFLYRVLVVACAVATVLGLLLIWGLEPERELGRELMRVLGTCVVLAVGSAITLSATRLVSGKAPEDDRG
ncbi:MAG: hypothetical protein WAT39_15550 [Planctomycetota bacterium]